MYNDVYVCFYCSAGEVNIKYYTCLKGSSVLGGPFFMDLINRFFNLKN